MNLIVALLLTLQQPQVETDRAVRKGITHLKTKAEGLGESGDVVLWTLVHAQVPESDPLLQRLLKDLLARPLDATRSVALQAMILTDLDREKYRYRIAQCAQFLIDSQGADGQWDAGRAIPLPELQLPPPVFPRIGPGGPRNFGPPKPNLPKVQLKKLQAGPEKGNPTDSRWAMWGLLAAERAAILPPVEVPARAELAWRNADADAADVVSCLCIALYLQGKEFKKDPDVLIAVHRLSDPKRPGDPVALSMVRVAMMHVGSEKLGDREWWPEGRKSLLGDQAADGSWGTIDQTCAAIRFLHWYRPPCPEGR
jgi:hypothetical protein